MSRFFDSPSNSKGLDWLYGAQAAPPPPSPAGYAGSGLGDFLSGLANQTPQPPHGFDAIYGQPQGVIVPTDNTQSNPDDFIRQLLAGLNITAPRVPMPQAPDFAALLAPYQQARTAAQSSADSGRGVIGDAYNHTNTNLDQLKTQYAQQVAAAQAQQQQANAGIGSSLSSALGPINEALAAQGVSAAPVAQQAGAIQATVAAAQSAADQMNRTRQSQTETDFTGRKGDAELVKEAALGTLQNNVAKAMQQIGLAESSARNQYQQQYEAAQRQATQQQFALDAQAAERNQSSAAQVNKFIQQLAGQGPTGRDRADAMLGDYAQNNPGGFNSRAITTYKNIVFGNKDEGIEASHSVQEALSRVDEAAKSQRLDPGVLRAWITAYYDKSHRLPDDWQDELKQYLGVLGGGGISG